MRTSAIGRTIVILPLLVIPGLAATAARPADPCALLTPAQVSSALGGTVGEGKPLATSVCQWAQQGKPGDPLLKVDVNVITPDHFTRLKTVTAGTVTAVNGLGDEAFYSTFTQGRTVLANLNVRKGGTAVVVRVSGGSKSAEEYQAKEKALAVALLPKL